MIMMAVTAVVMVVAVEVLIVKAVSLTGQLMVLNAVILHGQNLEYHVLI